VLLLFASPSYSTREPPINVPAMTALSLDAIVSLNMIVSLTVIVSVAVIVSLAASMIVVLVAAAVLFCIKRRKARLKI